MRHVLFLEESYLLLNLYLSRIKKWRGFLNTLQSDEVFNKNYADEQH